MVSRLLSLRASAIINAFKESSSWARGKQPAQSDTAGRLRRSGRLLAMLSKNPRSSLRITASLDHFGARHDTQASFWECDPSKGSAANESVDCRHQSHHSDS